MPVLPGATAPECKAHPSFRGIINKDPLFAPKLPDPLREASWTAVVLYVFPLKNHQGFQGCSKAVLNPVTELESIFIAPHSAPQWGSVSLPVKKGPQAFVAESGQSHSCFAPGAESPPCNPLEPVLGT